MIVPPDHEAVITRLGRYLRTQREGRTFVRPITDNVAAIVDLREQTVPITGQALGTLDARDVTIDAAIRLQVIDAKAATLEVANYRHAIEQLTCTALRAIAADSTVEQLRTSFTAIASQVRGVLDEISTRWGLRIVAVDVTAIAPVGHSGREYTSEGKL